MVEGKRRKQVWRIGELAALAGVTVRTLHHYEELGLLAPVEREGGAHRLYDSEAVEQLYRIRALRSFGISLREIQGMQPDGATLLALLREHLAHVDAEIDRQLLLRRRLQQLVGAESDVAPDALVETLDAMATLEHYARQRVAAMSAGDGCAIQDWNSLRDRLRTCMQAGVYPANDSVRLLAEQAQVLIAAFAGGDEAVQRALSHLRNTNPPHDFAGWDPQLFRYLEQALTASREGD